MDKIIALIGARCTPAGTARNTVDHESAPPKAQKLISEAYSKFKQQLHIWIGGLASDQIDTRVQIRITEEIKKELMIVNDEYHLDLQQKSSFFKLCQAILSLPIDMGIHSLIVKKLKQNGILHDSLVKFRNSYSETELELLHNYISILTLIASASQICLHCIYNYNITSFIEKLCLQRYSDPLSSCSFRLLALFMPLDVSRAGEIAQDTNYLIRSQELCFITYLHHVDIKFKKLQVTP